MRCRSAEKIWHSSRSQFSVEVVSQRRVEPFVCVFALHDTHEERPSATKWSSHRRALSFGRA